jgi:hypothetical protein
MPTNTKQPTGFQPPPGGPPNGEALITRGGAIDPDLLMAAVNTARRYPRDEVLIFARLQDALDRYPQYSDRMLYSIPYQDRRTNRTVRVEGLSIRAAETLRAEWGHIIASVFYTNEDEHGWDLVARVGDMEKNNWDQTAARCSKYEKTREGRVVLLDERRQLQVLGSAASKLKRNVVLSVLPLHLRAYFESEVRKKLAGGDLTKPAAPDRIDRAVERFSREHGVSAAQLEAYLEKPRSQWVGGDIATLQALHDALKDGEATIAEAFGPESPAGVTVEATGPVHPNTAVVLDARDAQLKESATIPASASEPSDSLTKPTDSPAAPKKKRATPHVEPTQVDMPEPTTVTRPGPQTDTQAAEEMTLRLRLSTEIAGASTPEACDAILGRIYLDTTVPRGVKRDALDWVSARRDSLQAQNQQ